MTNGRRQFLGAVGALGTVGFTAAGIASEPEPEIETLHMARTWSSPNGEKIIAMNVFDGRLYVATPSRLYLLL